MLILAHANYREHRGSREFITPTLGTRSELFVLRHSLSQAALTHAFPPPSLGYSYLSSRHLLSPLMFTISNRRYGVLGLTKDSSEFNNHLQNFYGVTQLSNDDTHTCSQIKNGSLCHIFTKAGDFKDAFWRFLRPHTIRGTLIGSISLVSRALMDNTGLIKSSLMAKALCGVFALLCGNAYIVGINQIYDIEIDKVNKPFLPIAAGDISVKTAWLLVLFSAITGVSITLLNFDSFVTSLYCLGLFLGTIYSVPPFRLKKSPVASFLIIATVRGFLFNFGVYYATSAALGLKFAWSIPTAFITSFTTLFALVIAITKDLPDVEGDRRFKIATLAVKVGVRNIALVASALLLLNYIFSLVIVISMPQSFKTGLAATLHSLLAISLIFKAWILERENYTKVAIQRYYRFVWYLFYAEYGVFPFI